MIQTLRDAANASPASEAENDRLYPLLADSKAREALVVNNVRLLQSMVIHFIRRHPQFAHLEDELLAEGLGQLAIVADTLVKTDCKCPTAYIIGSIRNCLYVTARNAEMVRVPRQNSTPPPKVKLNSRLLDGIVDEGLWSEERIKALSEEICANPEDRELLNMRQAGYSYTNIAASLGVTPGAVTRRFTRLRNAFLALRLFSRYTLPQQLTR